MNENRKEELLTRWLDDALTGDEQSELERLLESHPELRNDREEQLKIREKLRSVIPAEEEPPYPDFFNSHLERLVKESMSAPKDEKSRPGLRLWTWWMAPAAAAVVVAAFIAGMKSNPATEGGGVVTASSTEIYSPLSTVSAQVMEDEDLGATLIVVEGLDELRLDDLELVAGLDQGEHGYYAAIPVNEPKDAAVVPVLDTHGKIY